MRAAAADAPWYSDGAVTVEMFDANGEVVRVDRGERAGANAVAVYKELRTKPEVLTAWRSSVERLGRLMKEDRPKVNGILKVIDAFATQTPAEFHAKVKALPAVVQKSIVNVGHGDQLETKILVHGKTRVRIVSPLGTEIPLSDGGEPLASWADATVQQCYSDGIPDDCPTTQELARGCAHRGRGNGV